MTYNESLIIKNEKEIASKLLDFSLLKESEIMHLKN